MKAGAAVYGGFIGNETTLAAREWKNNKTILSGDFSNNDADFDSDIFTNISENAYTVVRASSLKVATRLDGFTISGGNNTVYVGGGIGINDCNNLVVFTNLIIHLD